MYIFSNNDLCWSEYNKEDQELVLYNTINLNKIEFEKETNDKMGEVINLYSSLPTTPIKKNISINEQLFAPKKNKVYIRDLNEIQNSGVCKRLFD